MSGDFTFFGRSASSQGLKVGAVNVYNAPGNRPNVFRVPGRIGDVYPPDAIEDWPNEIREYNIGLYMRGAANTSLEAKMAELRRWLMIPQNAVLSDTYEPSFYRLATMTGDFVPRRKGARNNFETQIAFSCDPRRFIANLSDKQLLAAGTGGTGQDSTSGETWAGIIYNKCYPILHITGTGNAFSLSFNNPNDLPTTEYGKITFAAVSGSFTLDCETLVCSNDAAITDISGELYMLAGSSASATQFVRSGTSGKITVSPRWFTR